MVGWRFTKWWEANTMNPEDIILCTSIDFVADDETSSRFRRDSVPKLLETRQKVSDLKLPIRLALKTTVVQRGSYDWESDAQFSWGISEDGINDFYVAIRELGIGGIDCFFETWPSGPARSWYNTLFDPRLFMIGFKAVYTADLDQFPTWENLENIVELDDKVRTNNSILGVGSRSVSVTLSYNPENAYLRRIMEGIMNLTVRNIGGDNVHTSSEGIVDLAFRDHGDMITGIYLFDLNHQSSRTFRDTIVETAGKNRFKGFEDEYFMVPLAARVGGVTAMTFKSFPNPYNKKEVEEERKSIVDRQIKLPIRALRNTFVRDEILKVIDMEYDGHGVLGKQKHYTPEQINEVCGYMKEVLLPQ